MPAPKDSVQLEVNRAGPARDPRGERFTRAQRILRRADFVRVQGQGRRVHTAHFIILLARSASGERRLGVTVGRKVGSAVRRNRIKRLLREAFRKNQAFFPSDCDVVLVARPGSDRLDYAAVEGELCRARSAMARVHKQLGTPPQPNGDA